jgi:hypothetical protein
LKLSALQPDKIPLKELTTLSLYQLWVSKQRCMKTLDKTRKALTPIIKSKFQHFQEIPLDIIHMFGHTRHEEEKKGKRTTEGHEDL